MELLERLGLQDLLEPLELLEHRARQVLVVVLERVAGLEQLEILA